MSDDSSRVQPSAKRLPPNAGKGRVAGVPNKATSLAREAIAKLVDDNAPKMAQWLQAIAADEKHGPAVAFRLMLDVCEYHIPKLARTEIDAHVQADIQFHVFEKEQGG